MGHEILDLLGLASLATVLKCTAYRLPHRLIMNTPLRVLASLAILEIVLASLASGLGLACGPFRGLRVLHQMISRVL